MTADREQRVQKYRDASLRVDDLAHTGQRPKAIALAERMRDEAAAAGDEDYRLFFEAESLGYQSARGYRPPVDLLDQALAWAAAHCPSPDSFLLRQRGVHAGLRGLLDEALQWFDEALKVNPQDYAAMRGKGVLLSQRGALDEAAAWYRRALDENPNDAITSYNLAAVEFNRDNPVEALALASRAARLNPARFRNDFRLICLAVGRDPEIEWAKLFPTAAAGSQPGPYRISADSGLDDLKGLILAIRNAYRDTSSQFMDDIEKAEKLFDAFLTEESHFAPSRSVLLFLRRWNSYTPAVPSPEGERSKGGGYFLWHRGQGIVIDPGYDFLDHFARAGGRLCDIHSIILTHAHDDHTAEFESLCMLLHRARKQHTKVGCDAHRVRILLSNGAMAKFSGFLPLRGLDYIARVDTLSPGWECELADGLHLRVLPAYHDDVLSHDQSVGLLLTARTTTDNQRTLLFTSDTGLFPLQRDCDEPTPVEGGPELWQAYPQVDGKPLSPDLMVVHIGSVKEDEFKMDLDKGVDRACYPNHLGIIGAARMIVQCRPKLAVVSEFGEEMKEFRLDLVTGLQEQVINQVLAGEHDVPRVIPGDLPLIYDIAEGKVYSNETRRLISVRNMRFGAAPGPDQQGEVNMAYYFSNRGHFTDDSKGNAKYFWLDIETQRGLYFRHGK